MDILSALNMKLAALVAGLLGVAVSVLRRTRLSVKARLLGFLLGSLCVLYIIPAVLWGLARYWQIELSGPVENFISFVGGLASVRLAEQFIDDPVGTVKFYVLLVRRIRLAPADEEAGEKKTK